MNPIDNIAMQVAHSLAAASIKACLVLIVAFAVTLLMRRASGASRHLVWTLSLAGILAAPFLDRILPTWRLAVFPAPTPAPMRETSPRNTIAGQIYPSPNDRPVAESSLPQREPGNSFQTFPAAAQWAKPVRAGSTASAVIPHPFAFWLVLVWAGGVIGVGVSGAVGAWMVHRAGRRARNANDGPLDAMLQDLRGQLIFRRRVRLLVADEAAMPITWGIVHPRILLPREAIRWPQERARSVLLHELAHVQRWDCATQLMALLACAMYWFNPLAWLAARRMRIERERACDDIVIGRGSSATVYAEYLVLLARHFRTRNMQALTAVAMARRSGLTDRVKAILNANVNRTEMNRRAKIILMIAIAAVLLPLSALHLMNRSSGPGAALAGQATPSPATMPSDEQLLPLPDRFSSRRVAIQVLSPAAQPMRIDSIASIFVWIQPDSRWMDGPTPQVLARYAQGWVLVDKQMFVLAQPGQRVDVTFSSGGAALVVSAKYPADNPRKITFTALYDPEEIGVDTSAGPVAAKDELAGQVVDPQGKPLAGAVVSFPRGFGKPLRTAVTTTDDGVFRFPGFGDQQFLYLQVEKAGYATRMLTDVPVGQGFLVHMDNRTRLKGQLTGPDGSPASNAKIEIVTSKVTARTNIGGGEIPNLTVSAQADNQGRYDVPLEPGEYELRITAPSGSGKYEHIQVASGQVVDMPQKLAAGVDLKITAIDTLTNKPAPGVKLYIVTRGPFFMGEMEGSERTTDANGTVEWDKLMPGKTEVGVLTEMYGRWWTDEMNKNSGMRGIDVMPINLSQGMPPVVVHFEPAVRVTGQVLSPDGRPVAGAQVDIAGLWTGDARYARRTDANGNFKLAFPVLIAGSGNFATGDKYAIVASDTHHRWANAAGDWFTPAVGQTLSCTLKMTPGARARGRIIASNGQPVAHLEVQGQAEDQLDRIYYNPRTLTDDSGRFELGPMRAVRYSIYFSANPGRVGDRNEPAPTLSVAEGDRVDIGDMRYDGPAPSAVPTWYAQEYGQPAPLPPSNDAGWRRVAVANPTAIAAPAGATPAAMTSAAEEELLGTPATPGELSGKVVDEAGHPLEGVSIRVWTWQPGHGDTTDDDGRFSLKDLDANRNVEIRFSKDGYCPKYIPQQPTGLSGLVVVLTNKTWFQGQVKGPDAKSVVGAKVRADQGPKQGDGVTITSVWTETNTDTQGNYKLYVQPDAYDVQVRVPGVGAARTGKIAIAQGEARHLDITLTSGITFAAQVVDSITGQPVAGVRLWSWQHAGVEGRSDTSGNLAVQYMEPGRFSFDVDAKGYARWWSDQAVSQWNRRQFIDRNGKWQRNFDNLDFDVGPGMAPVRIVVERQVTVRGKVVDPDGQPVMGATVAPALTGTGNSLTGDTRFSVTTNSGGVFEMTLPASGDHDYNLVAHDGDYQQWRNWANGVLPPMRTKPGQELEDVTLSLNRPAVVRGRVTDADGNPVVGREVRAVASDLLENRYYDPTAKTDKEGNFVLEFVRPGDQVIQVAPFWLKPSEAPSGTSKTVTLTAGQTLENVNLTTSPDGRR